MDMERIGVADMVLLEDFNSEKAFIANLKERYNKNIIYTYIGQVLLSVNPYKPLTIYTDEYVRKYHKKHAFEVPPHIFAVTEEAYRSLRQEKKDQCILISGESGAGKTEASKKILQFIAGTSGHNERVEQVKDKLLKSNPILEAFGNAKTNRNENSSRFGKYMDVIFEFTGEPMGGDVTIYLLEKSRVIRQNGGERNFHIFYQLLYGAEISLLKTFSLNRNILDYSYLSPKTVGVERPHIDARQYEETRQAMETMELTDEEQGEIFAIIAAILHLGNVQFVQEEAGEASEIQNATCVDTVCSLLQCSEKLLKSSLTHKSIRVNEVVVRSALCKEMAENARDALAKAVYDRLFTWLVSRINKSIQLPGNDAGGYYTNVMGILDIYGFEVFKTNGFEQFCINYCNEKLQQLFVELTLKSEQEEYLREGIGWEHVHYFNNEIICNLIDEKHKGIISILDDESLRLGHATDTTFLEKLVQNFGNHPHFVYFGNAPRDGKKKIARDEFKLNHYAGQVKYTVTGFVEKNDDSLFRDLVEAMKTSESGVLSEIFCNCATESKKRPETSATQFKNSLSQLMDLLKMKQPSYVRCIKPNDFKLSGVFKEEIVSHQVKYLGLMENVRVRRAGFAYRQSLTIFLQRYKSLCPSLWPSYAGEAKNGVTILMDYLGFGSEHYIIGKTKIFVRYSSTLFVIEDKFQARKGDLAIKIQTCWRSYKYRRHYLNLRKQTIKMQALIRGCLGRREADRRKRAVFVIRSFIRGFMTRKDAQNGKSERFLGLSRVAYLRRLSKSLPKNLLDKSWPPCPNVCKEASQHLHRLYRKWLARKYLLRLKKEERKQLALKALAQSLFKGKKENYQDSVAAKFVGDRLTPSQRNMRRTFMFNNSFGKEKLVYSCQVVKFDRHGYKRRARVLVVTKSAVYILNEKGKSFGMKHRLEMKDILGLEMTSKGDHFLLVRISPQLTEQKGDLILHVPNIIECATKMIKTLKNDGLVRFNDVENGTLSHNLIGEKPRAINISKYGVEAERKQNFEGTKCRLPTRIS